MTQAIITKYMGPTNSRGSRITATLSDALGAIALFAILFVALWGTP